MSSVIPVSNEMRGGTLHPGSTSDWSSPTHSPPRYLAAAISVRADVVGEPPVVSTSSTANDTSNNGAPRSNPGSSHRSGSDPTSGSSAVAGRPRPAPRPVMPTHRAQRDGAPIATSAS